MRVRLMGAAVSVLMLAGTGTALAKAGSSSGPGPNGNNNHGLCNAYFNGSAQGQAQKQAHGKAFLALEAAAIANDQAQDMNTPPESMNDPNTPETTNEQVADYCNG